MAVKGDFRIRRSLAERFHEKIMYEPNSGCHLWMGGTKDGGYGIIGLGGRNLGTDKAHRVAWRLLRGEIPEGGNVLHKCDTPACCNPDHLYIGTLADNARDCVRRGRNFIPNNRGERAKWAKLNADQAREIKKHEKTSTEYAAMYGVSRSAVHRIWEGKNWASV